MDDLVSEFLSETNESLSELDTQLVTLEQNPEDESIIGSIFRVMHTIKGTCGFLGLGRLESVAHAGEDVLDNIRSGKLKISAEKISIILEAIDRIKGIISSMEETGAEPAGDDTDLIKRLKKCAEGEGAAASAPASAPKSSTEELEQLSTGEAPAKDSMDLQALFDAAPGPGEEGAVATPAATETISEEIREDAIDQGLKTAQEKSGGVKAAQAAAQNIRVNLSLLENLMQMASELVLTRNQLVQINRNQTNSNFTAPLQRLSNITTEIQESVMKTRMQPISNAWAKFPRLVRDLAIEVNKKIDLEMIGAETEMDRQMLEMIKDPLTHMVRNAADHGLDTPAERRAAGKNETGTITLNSYHEGGHIIIKISDDGRGINSKKIAAKAIEKGLATSAEISSMTEKQIIQFICKAGFSTAEKITAVSGRGVGMDVVVSNIEKIGGTLEIESVLGKGSAFIIKLPLTLAIMSVLLVESGNQMFAIPQIRVSEIVHAHSEADKTAKTGDDFIIETIKDTSVLRLRGKLLPLVSLSELLNMSESDKEKNKANMNHFATGNVVELGNRRAPSNKKPELRKFIVVCEVGSSHFGIIVEKVYDTEEIVVKPKSALIKNIEIYSGCTILGDGSVVLILDPNGIMKTMGNIRDSDKDKEKEKSGDKLDSMSDEEEIMFLLFKGGGKAPKAVPLELVSRIEEIRMEKTEWAGDKMVIQYRDHLMRLTTTDNTYTPPAEGVVEVIVFNDEDKILGLIVQEVTDIVKHPMNIKSMAGNNGILGSLVIKGMTYDLVDIGYHFSNVFNDWLMGKPLLDKEKESDADVVRKNLLLVDDSPFFRKFMKPILVVANYNVTTAENGKIAFDILKKGETEFDAIITDIEMPEMDGIEFIKACKAEQALSNIPFIALTSFHSGDLSENIDELGFSGFVSKSDRDKLVDTIINVLTATTQNKKAAVS